MGLRGPQTGRFVRAKLRSLAADISPERPPIKVTAAMIDLLIRQHKLQPVYINCLRGACKSKNESTHCKQCLEYMKLADRMRSLSGMVHWTTDGLADTPEPPHGLVLNPKAIVGWHRQWRLRLDLVAAAKKREK